MSRLSTYMALPTMRGSNANGSFVRFADGTQICSRKYTFASGSVAPSVAVTSGLGSGYLLFAAAFFEAPAVIASLGNISGGPPWITQLMVSTYDVSTTFAGITLSAFGPSNLTLGGNLIADMTAIGRWF